MTTAPPLGDAELMARWVAESSARDAFWSSAPAWTPDSAHRDVDGYLLVYTPGGILQIAPGAAVVPPFFDGTSTLAELAEDLASAAEVDVEVVRPMVASVAVELQAWGAVTGVDAVPPPDSGQEAGETVVDPVEYTVVDAESGQEIRVEEGLDAHGNRMVTEFLPDGRRRVTSYLTYGVGDGAAAMADAEGLAAALLDGERSAAELLPAESCLGSKLRNDDAVPLVSIRCPDGKVRSVRCHDPAVADELRRRAGTRLETAERGPIEAFVVTPLEGEGPDRVYDGRGHRRGRPRTVTEVVEVVDQVLGEDVARRAAGEGAPVLLNGVLAARGDVAVLVEPDVVEHLALRRALRAGGWRLASGLALAAPGPVVATPSVLGPGWDLPAHRVRVPFTGPLTAGELLPRLVDSLPAEAPGEEVLDRLVATTQAVLAPSDAHQLPVELVEPV